jgi:hypothetical protein
MKQNIDFTVSFFLKPSAVSGDNFDGIISKMWPSGGTLGANNGWQIGRGNSTIKFQSRSGVSANEYENEPCGIDYQSVIEVDKTDHYLFLFDRTKGVLNFFLNGVFVNTLSCINLNDDFSNNYPLLIGTEREKSLFYNGIIDDIRIYNRALTPSEITYLATH